MTRMIIGGLILALLGAIPTWANDLEQVLSRIEAAYGGESAVNKLESYHAEGVTMSKMLGATGTMVREYRAPNRLKVVIEYPQRSEVRILDGARAWRGSKTGMRPVEGPMRAAMEYQLLRSDLPGVLLRNRNRLEDRGLVEHEGGQYRRIVLRWSETVEMRYWIDSETFLITHIESTLNLGGHEAVFATAYDDFRTVDGVVFPFRETNYASGTHVADTVVERLIVDPARLGPFLLPHPPTDEKKITGESEI